MKTTEEPWTSRRQLRKWQKLKRRKIMENHERNGEINMLRGINSKHNLNQPESNWINLVNQTESTWINLCYATRMPLAFVQFLYGQTINFCVLSENSHLQPSAAGTVSALIYITIVIGAHHHWHSSSSTIVVIYGRHQRLSLSTIVVINDRRHQRSWNTHHLHMYCRLNSEYFSAWLIWTKVQF